MTLKIIKTETDLIGQFREAQIRCWELKNSLKKPTERKCPTREEAEYLIENIGRMPLEEIAEKLKRKKSTVQCYAGALHLTTLFLNEYELTYNSLIAILTGKPAHAYDFFLCQKYGMPIYFNETNWQRLVNLLDFFKWYKSNLKIINLSAYKIGTLPIEPDWFLEKAVADKRAFRYVYKRPWTKKEEELLRQMVSEGRSYLEVSRTLKRTGFAIKRRCTDLNISKPKRQKCKKWTPEEIERLKELWLKGYEMVIIGEELNRQDRQVSGILERYNYFGNPPLKFVKAGEQ